MKQQRSKMLIACFALLLGAMLAPRAALAEPFIGEIRWVAFSFAPVGWAKCDGQAVPIASNTALFALLGTTYGGDGKTTFNLPDLRGRAPIHVNPSYNLGSVGGEEAHVLTFAELPQHTHPVMVDPREATSTTPAGNVLAKTSDGSPAYSNSISVTMPSATISVTGNAQPHENMKPYITLNCIIATQGIFPSRP